MSRQGERGISGFGRRRRPGSWFKAGLCAFLLVFAFHPASLRACAACYGQSDSPMAQGMNWGIFSLLGVVTVVLGSVAAFFVYLARRANAQPPPEAESLLEPTSTFL